jgi:hypothetical protein
MTDRYSGGSPWFDSVDVYPSAAQLPAGGDYGTGFCVVLNPPSLYIYTPSLGYQLVAASTPTTPATPASEGGQGIVELASQSEIESGASGVLVPTAQRLKSELDRRAPAAASETVSGLVELATQGETLAGGDALRAVHPSGLKYAVDRRSAVGYFHATKTADQTIAGNTFTKVV